MSEPTQDYNVESSDRKVAGIKPLLEIDYSQEGDKMISKLSLEELLDDLVEYVKDELAVEIGSFLIGDEDKYKARIEGNRQQIAAIRAEILRRDDQQRKWAQAWKASTKKQRHIALGSIIVLRVAKNELDQKRAWARAWKAKAKEIDKDWKWTQAQREYAERRQAIPEARLRKYTDHENGVVARG